MAAPGGEETFISHLVELRDRLLRAVAAVVVAVSYTHLDVYKRQAQARADELNGDAPD